LIRASINLRKKVLSRKVLSKKMVHRVIWREDALRASCPAMTISIGVAVSKRLVGRLFDN